MNQKVIDNINLIKSYNFFKKLSSLPFVNKIYLYGSRARGDNKERSDIDLAFYFEKNYDWFKVEDILDKADTLLIIDYVNLNNLEDDNPLKVNIKKEGKLLFEQGFNE